MSVTLGLHNGSVTIIPGADLGLYPDQRRRPVAEQEAVGRALSGQAERARRESLLSARHLASSRVRPHGRSPAAVDESPATG